MIAGQAPIGLEGTRRILERGGFIFSGADRKPPVRFAGSAGLLEDLRLGGMEGSKISLARRDLG